MPIEAVSQSIETNNLGLLCTLIENGLVSLHQACEYILTIGELTSAHWEMLLGLSVKFHQINIFRLVGFAIDCDKKSHCNQFIDSCSESRKELVLDGACLYALEKRRYHIADCLLDKGANPNSLMLSTIVEEVGYRMFSPPRPILGQIIDESAFAEEVYVESEAMQAMLIPLSYHR